MQKEDIHSYAKLFIEIAASFSAVVYLTGFLCTNSHLLKFGFAEINFLSPQYFLTGLLVLLCLLNLYFFGGRQLVSIEDDNNKEIQFFRERGYKWLPILSLLIIIESWINIPFITLVGVSTAIRFIFVDNTLLEFIIILAAGFLILYPFERFFDLDIKAPVLYRIVFLIFKGVSTYVFFKFVQFDTSIFLLTLGYFSLLFVMNFLIDEFKRRKIGVGSINFLIFAVVLQATVFAIYFGQTLLPYVKPSLGGAAPLKVEIRVADDIGKMFKSESGDFVPVEIIARGEKFVTFKKGGGLDDEGYYQIPIEKLVVIKSNSDEFSKRDSNKTEQALRNLLSLWN